MRGLILLALGLAAVVAVPENQQRIVGGSVTHIDQYPYSVVLLYSRNQATYSHSCGGTIIGLRTILTAAHCTIGDLPNNWRGRIGSSYASSGGTVHAVSAITNHQNYNSWTVDNDMSLLRTSIDMAMPAASIAGPNYNLPDNTPVWVIGWGRTSSGGPVSEQLRHVQVWTVNQNICRERYASVSQSVTDNMLCSGWLDVGGRDACQGDSGGPVLHNGVVVGVTSWGRGCAQARFPGVNARVSRYTSWIQSNV